MVRLTVTVTVTVLLFFFTVSYARNPSNPPQYEVINQDLLNSSPESDANPTNLLVTEKSKSNAPQGFDLKPKIEVTDAENPHIENTEEDIPESETLTINEMPLARPLTTLNFHPINRHFRVRRSYPFRLSRHLFNPTSGFGHRPQVRVSYGDSDFDHHPALFHDGRRQILAKWVKFHHNHYGHRDDDDKKQTFLFKKHHMLGKEKFKKHFRHAEEDDREEGGFMNRIRKFLNF